MLCLSLFSCVYTAAVCPQAGCAVRGEVKWNNNNKNGAHWMRLLHIYVDIFAWNVAPLCLDRDRDGDRVLYMHAHTPDIIIIAVLVVRRPNKRMRWKRRKRNKYYEHMSAFHIQLFKLMPDSYFTRGQQHKARTHSHAHKEPETKKWISISFYPFIRSFSVCASEWLGDGAHRLCDPF